MAISPYRFSQFAPALSGLPPDPAPPLCHTQPPGGGLCVRQSWRLLRCSARGALHPRLSLLGARSALPAPQVRGLDWRHGVGRRRRTTRTPKRGCPWRGSRTCPDSPRRCSGLSNTSDTRLRCASPTKRGRKTQECPRPKTGKKRPRTQRNAGVQVTHNRLLPERVAGGAGAGPARLVKFT